LVYVISREEGLRALNPGVVDRSVSPASSFPQREVYYWVGSESIKTAKQIASCPQFTPSNADVSLCLLPPHYQMHLGDTHQMEILEQWPTSVITAIWKAKTRKMVI
jgi:hypothetical protein